MNIPHFISALLTISAVLSLIFGIYIIRLNPRLGLYRVFLLLCMVSAVSAFGSGMMFCAQEKHALFFWANFSITGCIFVNSVNLHLCVLLTKKRLKNIIAVLIYLPSAAIIILNFTLYPIIADFVRYGIFWKFIPVYNITVILFMLCTSSFILISCALFFRKYLTAAVHKERLQVRTILAVCVPLWIVLSITDYLLPRFDFYHMLPLGPLGRIFYIFILWYAILKYRFMIFTPSVITDEIISNIQDMVLVLSPELMIITANSAGMNILAVDRDKQNERSFYEYIYKAGEIMPHLAGIIQGEIDNQNLRITYKSGHDRIMTDTYCSRITDKYGDFTGILLISKINKSLKYIQKTYNLSDRQVELVDLCLTGMSNEEISNKLAISKKTTESHFCNIYNKMGVNSRIELYNRMKEVS